MVLASWRTAGKAASLVLYAILPCGVDSCVVVKWLCLWINVSPLHLQSTGPRVYSLARRWGVCRHALLGCLTHIQSESLTMRASECLGAHGWNAASVTKLYQLMDCTSCHRKEATSTDSQLSLRMPRGTRGTRRGGIPQTPTYREPRSAQSPNCTSCTSCYQQR